MQEEGFGIRLDGEIGSMVLMLMGAMDVDRSRAGGSKVEMTLGETVSLGRRLWHRIGRVTCARTLRGSYRFDIRRGAQVHLLTGGGSKRLGQSAG